MLSHESEVRPLSVRKVSDKGLLRIYESANYTVKEFDPGRTDEAAAAIKSKVLRTHERAAVEIPDLIVEHKLPELLRANIKERVLFGILGEKDVPVIFDHPIVREKNTGKDGRALIEKGLAMGDLREVEILMKEILRVNNDTIRRGFFPIDISPERYVLVNGAESKELRIQDLELLNPDYAHVERLLSNDEQVDQMRTTAIKQYGNLLDGALDKESFRRFFNGYFINGIKGIFNHMSTYQLGHERRAQSRRKDPVVNLVGQAS